MLEFFSVKTLVKPLLAACSLLASLSVSADVTIWVRSTAAPHIYAWDDEQNVLNGQWNETVALTTRDDVDAGSGKSWWLCILRDVNQAN